MNTISYKESLSMKIFVGIAFLLITGGIIIMIKNHSYHLIWGIPGYLYLIWGIINIWQQEIIIDDQQLIQKFGNFTKPKTMAWENVDYVIKDGFADIILCRLVTKCLVKPKVINISGIKDMKSLIIEIVKRSKYAEVDPVFKELAEKGNESK